MIVIAGVILTGATIFARRRDRLERAENANRKPSGQLSVTGEGSVGNFGDPPPTHHHHDVGGLHGHGGGFGGGSDGGAGH